MQGRFGMQERQLLHQEVRQGIRQRRCRIGLLDCKTDENQTVEFFLEFKR